MNKLNVDDLVEKGLVRKKTYTEGRFKGLSILKYHRKVFYDNLWHLDDRLLDCRGTVVDEDNNVIVLPFKKIFNVGENYTNVPDEALVECPVKLNGFMGAVTLTKDYGLICSTTGSLDSDFSLLVEKWVNKLGKEELICGITYLFEVCDESDPHIVKEEEGIYLIGARWHDDGRLLRECGLDTMSLRLGCKRVPAKVCTFKEIKEELKTVTHEGFMVRDLVTGNTLTKLKSPHYLSTKCLMRLGKKNIDILFRNTHLFKRRVDEEFYPIVDKIAKRFDRESWGNYTEQQRRVFIEGYFNAG
tara:strand:+ start:1577 stop:2479 length:903 start_codon:yes stop_codon:yes gene_type:complete